MFVRFLCVFDLLFNLFRIALWPIVGKELSPLLFTCAVFISCRLNCRCPFPVWCLGQDVEFDCIGSWSLPRVQGGQSLDTPKFAFELDYALKL